MAGRVTAIRKAVISRYRHSVALTELSAECFGSCSFSVPRFPSQLASASCLHSTNIRAYPAEASPDPVNPPEGYNPPEKETPGSVSLAAQWQYFFRNYSRYTSLAWAMVIVTGCFTFGVSSLIKGSDPMDSAAAYGDDHEHEDRGKRPSQASK